MIPDPAQVPTVSVATAASWYGLGRSAGYEAAARGEIPTIRIGRRLVVPVAAVRRQLGLDVEAPRAAEPGAPALSLIRGSNEVRRESG
jgi:hypothetical protein